MCKSPFLGNQVPFLISVKQMLAVAEYRALFYCNKLLYFMSNFDRFLFVNRHCNILVKGYSFLGVNLNDMKGLSIGLLTVG